MSGVRGLRGRFPFSVFLNRLIYGCKCVATLNIIQPLPLLSTSPHVTYVLVVILVIVPHILEDLSYLLLAAHEPTPKLRNRKRPRNAQYNHSATTV